LKKGTGQSQTGEENDVTDESDDEEIFGEDQDQDEVGIVDGIDLA
jgi:hypothetical protein